MLKDKTSSLGRAKKAFILKFRHIELAISGVFTLKFKDIMLDQINQRILWLDLLKISINEDFDLASGISILKQFWASKHKRIPGVNMY